MISTITTLVISSIIPVVSLSAATVCFDTECHPVLIGTDTPKGTYPLKYAYTNASGYGGEVIVFNQTDKATYAIHRVWTGRPQERRLERLGSDLMHHRVITKGCINVDEQTFLKLKQSQAIIIKD